MSPRLSYIIIAGLLVPIFPPPKTSARTIVVASPRIEKSAVMVESRRPLSDYGGVKNVKYSSGQYGAYADKSTICIDLASEAITLAI